MRRDPSSNGQASIDYLRRVGQGNGLNIRHLLHHPLHHYLQAHSQPSSFRDVHAHCRGHAMPCPAALRGMGVQAILQAVRLQIGYWQMPRVDTTVAAEPHSKLLRRKGAAHVWAGGEGTQPRRCQTLPVAIGRTPPLGLEMGRSVYCRKSGAWGSPPWTMADMSSSKASSASGLAHTAALACSYVQPLGPAAKPRGTASNTFSKVLEVTSTRCSTVAGGCGVLSWGCNACRASSTSSVTSSSGDSSRTKAAREMLPSCSWRRMCHFCFVPL
jgi:hypothetical protein